MITILVLITILVVSPVTAAAQEPPLVTGRPGITASPLVVPRGSIQLETGFSWERGVDDDDTISGPELLLRWGIASRVELRFGIPDYITRRDADESGLGDGSIGAKVELGGERTGGWDLAVIAAATLPTGDDEFTSDEVDPTIVVTAGRALTSSWSLGTQISGEWPTAGDERVFFWGGTLVVGRTLGERAGAFLEAAATVPEEGDAAVVLHHGYTYLISPLLQVDVHGGVGLSDTAPDAFAGAGLSVRR